MDAERYVPVHTIEHALAAFSFFSNAESRAACCALVRNEELLCRPFCSGLVPLMAAAPFGS